MFLHSERHGGAIEHFAGPGGPLTTQYFQDLSMIDFPVLDTENLRECLALFEKHSRRLRLSKSQHFEAAIAYLPSSLVRSYFASLRDSEKGNYDSFKAFILQYAAPNIEQHVERTPRETRASHIDYLVSTADDIVEFCSREEVVMLLASLLCPEPIIGKACESIRHGFLRWRELVQASFDRYEKPTALPTDVMSPPSKDIEHFNSAQYHGEIQEPSTSQSDVSPQADVVNKQRSRTRDSCVNTVDAASQTLDDQISSEPQEPGLRNPCATSVQPASKVHFQTTTYVVNSDCEFENQERGRATEKSVYRPDCNARATYERNELPDHQHLYTHNATEYYSRYENSGRDSRPHRRGFEDNGGSERHSPGVPRDHRDMSRAHSGSNFLPYDLQGLTKESFPGVESDDITKCIYYFEVSAFNLYLTEEAMYYAAIRFLPQPYVRRFLDYLGRGRRGTFRELKSYLLSSAPRKFSCHSYMDNYHHGRSFTEIRDKAEEMARDPPEEIFKVFCAHLCPKPVQDRARRAFKYGEEKFLDVLEQAFDEYHTAPPRAAYNHSRDSYRGQRPQQAEYNRRKHRRLQRDERAPNPPARFPTHQPIGQEQSDLTKNRTSTWAEVVGSKKPATSPQVLTKKISQKRHQIDYRRKRSIIIFNAKENDNKSDSELFEDICKSLKVKPTNVVTERFRSCRDGCPRPLKITFVDEMSKKEFLHATSYLGSTKFASLRVRQYMTTSQRLIIKSLLRTAYELNQKGTYPFVYKVRGPPWNSRIVKIPRPSVI